MRSLFKLTIPNWRSHTPFVWNATNLVRSRRQKLVNLFTAYGAKTKIVYLETSLKELKLRNKSRQQTVPENIFDRYISNLEIPDLTEAHQIEWFVD